jgi:hypothetical protein
MPPLRDIPQDSLDHTSDVFRPSDVSRTVTNMGEGDVMEETDTVQFFDKTANRLGVKVK